MIPTVTLETIQPEEARRILDHYNSENRAMKPESVTMIAADLSDNRFAVNGETIKFAGDGTLLDGQNRLSACVRSNRPLTTFVVRGLDKSVFDTIDIGLQRTGGDLMHVQKEEYATVLAASLQYVAIHEQGNLGGRIRIPKSRLRSILEKHPGLRQSVKHIAESDLPKQKLAPRSMLAFLHYMFSKASPEKAAFFFARLADGTNLPGGNPIWALRERLSDNAKSKTSKIPSTVVMALCLKAWDLHWNNRTVKSLAWTAGKEEFPSIAGLDEPGKEMAAA